MALLFLGIDSYGQKMTGVGGELSVVGFKPNLRKWLSRTNGYEIFGGVAAELGDFKPNDYEGGVKYLNTFIYNRTERTYFGLMGKWKWVDVGAEENTNINLPVIGVLIGKEWFSNRANIRAFAIELGYQYGVKDYNVMHIDGEHILGSKKQYDEFPLVLNLRFSLYKK
jgi:hypothetical protein